MAEEHWPKSKILELFQGIGVKFVVLGFNGGSDSGEVSSIRLFADTPATSQPVMDLLEAVGQSIGVSEEFSYLSLVDSLSKPIFDKYCGFDGEPYVDGNLTWDITTGELEMTGDETVSVSESFTNVDVAYVPGTVE